MQCIGGAALFVVCALKTDVVTVADQGGGGGGGYGGPFSWPYTKIGSAVVSS